MSFYPEETIEEVRQRNDIVDVVGQYVSLKKKGANYWGLCPFHSEKTGSFSVNRNLQIFKCFGCGKGGNVISFVMEYENFTFPEAVKHLAERSGVTLPEREESEEDKKRRSEREKLLEINKEAATFFYYMLRQDQGKHAYDYLAERGLSDETMKKFGLGYAGKYSDALYKYLKNKGYKDEFLKNTGLVTIDERGGFDKFWNRVMFPIMDVGGKVIAFGGRIMGDPGKSPKYLNSPETKVFDKGRNLFALNLARRTKKDYFLLCEGYMDVIALHQAGFDNAVASLGTSLTENQAKLISRYVKSVIITYDSDGAGTKAALRAIPILKSVGISVKVLNMNPYKDPDEFIKALGAEEYQRRIDSSLNSFFYEVDRLAVDKDMADPDVKTKFVYEIAEKLARIDDEIARDSYIDAVSRRYSIRPEVLRRQSNQMGREVLMADAAKEAKERERQGAFREEGLLEDSAEKKNQNSPRNREATRDDGLRQTERILLTYLATDVGLFERIKGIITAEDFSDDIFKEVAGMVFNQYEKEERVTPARIISRFEDGDRQAYVAGLFSAVVSEDMDEAGNKKAFADTVIRVREASLKRQFQVAASVGDAAKLQEITLLQKEVPKLRAKLMQ